MTEPAATPPPIVMNSAIFDGNSEAIDELGVPTSLRFFATETGWFLDKKTYFGRVIHPVKENPFAAPLPYSAKLWTDVPSIPAAILNEAWGFFRAAWKARKSEAMVYLLDVAGEYRLHIPRQHVNAGHVDAKLDPLELPTGAQIVGDLHSHCNFSAFHSSTDQADARKNDGLHITIGHVDTDHPGWAVMLAYSGFLWDITLEDVTTAPITDLAPTDPPTEWLARIDEPAPIVVNKTWPTQSWYHPNNQPTSWKPVDNYDQWDPYVYNPNNHLTYSKPIDHYDPWEPYVRHNYQPSDEPPLPTGWNRIDELLDSTDEGELTEYEIETLEWCSWHLDSVRDALNELGYNLNYTIVSLPYRDDSPRVSDTTEKELQA